MKFPFLIIGGGLSGLAAGIRLARFVPDVCILERHSRVGGLNSFYHRHGLLLETGLHAFTNHATVSQKQAPLNLLFRQLKLSRKNFMTRAQKNSVISFRNYGTLSFTNDIHDLEQEIQSKFSKDVQGFRRLVRSVKEADPFNNPPSGTARSFLKTFIQNPLLAEMLLCPLLYYGSSCENDMDLGQFLIMFRSIYMEGLFRPEKTMREFLDFLVQHYTRLGGQLRLSTGISQIIHTNKQVSGVKLENGDFIECEHLLSTVGYEETLALLGEHDDREKQGNRLSFVENIYHVPFSENKELSALPTIAFYNNSKRLSYMRPDTAVDFSSGALCFPTQFSGLQNSEFFEIRSTHLANYHRWKTLSANRDAYIREKENIAAQSKICIEQHLGCSLHNIVHEDTFTPPYDCPIQQQKRRGRLWSAPENKRR